jgi:hypothetical protein
MVDLNILRSAAVHLIRVWGGEASVVVEDPRAVAVEEAELGELRLLSGE